MSRIKAVGRNIRRAKAKYASLIHAMDPEGVYTLTNMAGQKLTKKGSAWKAGLSELGLP